MKKRNKKYVTIPYLLIRNLPSEKKAFRVIAFYYQLKGLHNCGVIKNYRKRYQEIAKKLNIGESTVRMYISELKRDGLIEINDKNLLIKTKYNLIKWVGFDLTQFGKDLKAKEKIERLKSKTIRFNKSELYDKNKLIEFLYALKIYDNIEHKQKTAYLNKVLTERLVKDKDYCAANKKGKKRLYFQIRAKLLKEIGKLATMESKCVQKLVKTGNFIYSETPTDFINLKEDNLRKPDFTLSRKGVARILGRKSSTWGSSMVKKLKTKGYISLDKENTVAFRLKPNVGVRYIRENMYSIANRLLGLYKGCCIYYDKYNHQIMFVQSNTIEMNTELFFKHYYYYNNINPSIVQEIF